jgi:hypothetical protein
MDFLEKNGAFITLKSRKKKKSGFVIYYGSFPEKENVYE